MQADNNSCKLALAARSRDMAIFCVRMPGLRLRQRRRLCHVPLRYRTITLAILVAVVAPGFAQSTVEAPLTNAEIIKMVKAGIAESVILQKVQMSESNFATSPNALIELKRQHVPDSVMGAILDSENAMRMLAGNPGTAPPAGRRSANAGFHHLPTFDAAVRIDSKTTDKVSVGKNHIKVEQGGVPLFTLKWKETPK